MPLTPVEPRVPAVRNRRTTESAATGDPINRDAMRYQGFQFSYSVSQTGRRLLKLASSPTPPSQAGCKSSTSPCSIFGIPAAVPGLVPVPAPWGVPLARGPTHAGSWRYGERCPDSYQLAWPLVCLPARRPTQDDVRHHHYSSAFLYFRLWLPIPRCWRTFFAL